MAYFTEGQIKKAKEIDLLSYLENCNKDELVYEARGTYHTGSHDSLKISNGMWYWFSRGIGGKTALEYLIQVENFSFTDAVEHIIKQKGIEKRYIPKRELTEKEKIDKLKLPQKSKYNDRVINYLTNRGISKDIVIECINKGFIYQTYPHNNAVFVGYDDNNNPRYAGVRGTNASRFMCDAYGSDKAYSFKLKSIIPSNKVHIFESAIDLLSYATLKEMNNEKWNEVNLISLAGVYQTKADIVGSKIPKTISVFLKNNPDIDTIIVHFDNDNAGRLATKALQYSLSDSYKIIDDPAPNGKDFNDYLCNIKNINWKIKYEERER